MNTATTDNNSINQMVFEKVRNESYFELVWRRFKRSKPSIIGGIMVIMLLLLALFAEFFSPNDIFILNLTSAFIPPMQIHFFDTSGKFHLVPFVYTTVNTLDPKTFQVIWAEDKSKSYNLHLFVHGWKYDFLGIFPMDLHLFEVDPGGVIYILGTDKFGRDLFGKACQAGRVSLTMSIFATLISIVVGSVLGVVSGYYGGWIDNILQRFTEFVNAFPQLPLWMALAAIIPKTADAMDVFFLMSCIFALLTWTTLTREVRSKVMALRETDFIMAAKEMGASDARIIFRHLYPNTLSHVIVILTLTIPSVILAEAFLSFLGIGIHEPLVSWGLLMQNAQNIQTLGQNLWILTPMGFIVVAVLGLTLWVMAYATPLTRMPPCRRKMRKFIAGKRFSLWIGLGGALILVIALVLPAAAARLPALAQAATALPTTTSGLSTQTTTTIPSTISGTVVDANGPVGGAILQIKGTPNQTTAGKDGNYTFRGQGLGTSTVTVITAWAPGHMVGWATLDLKSRSGKQAARASPLPSIRFLPRIITSTLGLPTRACPGRKAAAFATGNTQNLPRMPILNQQSTHTFSTFIMARTRRARWAKLLILGADGSPLPPDPTKPYYGAGFLLDNPERTGNCATCHAPLASTTSNQKNCSWLGCHMSITSQNSASMGIMDPGVPIPSARGSDWRGFPASSATKLET